MPVCLECGFTGRRLQWTHFRYNCTGKFKNGIEYRVAYPGAKLVDDDLAAQTSITEKNLKKKYGEEEGQRRWDSYCEAQRYSNTLEYKKEKHGWTEEQFDEYNLSRAITLEKCIERHGEEDGKKKWDAYCEAQRYTNSLEYFVEKYGKDGREKWEYYNKEKGKSGNIDWVMEKHGVSREEAEVIISKRKYTKHTSDLEMKFLNQLENELGQTIKYTAKTRQFVMWNFLDHAPVFFDITDSSTKRIIEFHGDYWHCNPQTYTSDFLHPHSNKTAKEIWEHDYRKTKTALDRGFAVMVVWEKDYIENPEKTIREAKEWLTLSTP